MASLCHPWFTTTNLSYRFPIFWKFRHRLVRYYWYISRNLFIYFIYLFIYLKPYHHFQTHPYGRSVFNQQLVAGLASCDCCASSISCRKASHPTHRVMAARTAALNAAPLPNAPNHPPERISDYYSALLLHVASIFRGFQGSVDYFMLLIVGVNSVLACLSCIFRNPNHTPDITGAHVAYSFRISFSWPKRQGYDSLLQFCTPLHPGIGVVNL